MKDLTVTRPFSEEDYNELLQQAVAVIETSRLRIAKQLNTIAMSSYWEIGKLLDERKVDSKHGDVFAQRCNAFIFVIAHKFFLSNNSPSKWRAAYTSHRITAM